MNSWSHSESALLEFCEKEYDFCRKNHAMHKKVPLIITMYKYLQHNPPLQFVENPIKRLGKIRHIIKKILGNSPLIKPYSVWGNYKGKCAVCHYAVPQACSGFITQSPLWGPRHNGIISRNSLMEVLFLAPV